MPPSLSWIVGASHGMGKNIAHDLLIAGVGISPAILSRFGLAETILAVVVSALMVVLLALRIYNEYRRAKRQDLKDEQSRNDEE